MRYRHDMPFGAAYNAGHGTRFRLWAPAVSRVELVLQAGSSTRDLAMHALDDGWHEIHVASAEPGSRYCYRIDGGVLVPDPASRYNPDDVHGASAVVDPLAFEWPDAPWRGLAWEEAVIYELHVGTFTPAGTFDALSERLDYLAELGVTAVELMPLADFPGRRNWGYDGVLPYAPDTAYGEPEALKRLIQAAHARRMMVLLDVVYNHFGPEGNYLRLYAPQFFNPRHTTPWGAAINFDAAYSRNVRDYYIHNALYWIEEFQLDGLRLDAVHAIADDSRPDIVTEITAALREGPGRDRPIHIVLENDRNQARYLVRDQHAQPRSATAQWNDDIHHAAHVIATGECDGYYADYATQPLEHLGRCLADGFAYQGEASSFRGNALRGERSEHLPPGAFVNFLQTHDQVGNRAYGERIGQIADPAALAALYACILLAPAPPLIFMGEEFAAASPFLFFADFEPELAAAVTQGRRGEFAGFAQFNDADALHSIPDPCVPATFERSKLAWDQLLQEPHRSCLARTRELLALRRAEIVPRVSGMTRGGHYAVQAGSVLQVTWPCAHSEQLQLLANLSAGTVARDRVARGRCIYLHDPAEASELAGARLGPWSVRWTIEE